MPRLAVHKQNFLSVLKRNFEEENMSTSPETKNLFNLNKSYDDEKDMLLECENKITQSTQESDDDEVEL